MNRIYAAALSSIVTLGMFSPQTAAAQPSAQDQKAARIAACANPSTETVHTFFLKNVNQAEEANQIFNSIRQMLAPEEHAVLTWDQMAIEVCGTPDQVALAEKLIHDLDRPKKNYRLTYTVSEMDGAKRLSSQHFSMVVSSGQQTTLKQGSRVPTVTSSYNDKAAAQQTQVSYIDVGMNFDATVNESADGIILKTSAEQSSVSEAHSGVGPQDPVVRQANYRGTAYLVPGKTVKLGSFDIADTTRRLDLEVMMEPLP